MISGRVDRLNKRKPGIGAAADDALSAAIASTTDRASTSATPVTAPCPPPPSALRSVEHNDLH
jgi:hypothetical protein